jgi:CRISPR-associated protein Cas5d
MKPYPLQLEISGPVALWARPDTMPNPVSYVAPTFSAVKGIFEAILRWKSVNVRPTRCEICAPVHFHRYASSYGRPSWDRAAPCGTENHVILALPEMVFNQAGNISAN